MRLFFIEWANTVPELVEVVRDIKKRGHEIVYWSGYDQNLIDKTDFPETIFHDHFDALAGKSALGVDETGFPPLGENIIKQLYETELIILTMMHKKYSYLSIEQRKHFYYHLLQYWYGVLNKFQPDMIVFISTPHTVYNYVIYALAKLLHIRTVMFEYTWVNDRVLVLNDYLEGNLNLRQAIQENKKNFTLLDLNNDIQQYYKKQTNPNFDATPICTVDWRKKFSPKNILMIKIKMILISIKDLSIFSRSARYPANLFRSNLKKEYLKVQNYPGLDKKFVYVPLHFQPECSTSPLGGIFVDQILIIEILSASLPPDWVIYVKEHPMQWLPTGVKFSSHRYKNYYQHIAKLKNVYIVPLETNTYQLIGKAQAVASVTGTACWEALLRDKPCLIFGSVWYRDCEGVFRVSDASSCREALNRIEHGFKVDKQKVINYLALLDKFTFHGHIDSWSKETSTLSQEENFKNFLKVLLLEINKL